MSSPPQLADDPAPATAAPERFIETTQTIVTALILAFVFRAFFVEQFIIPTGSMAPGLLGAHATRICPACGCEYDFGPYTPPRDDSGFVRPPEIVCPNCHLRLVPTVADTQPKGGDRILVDKWSYSLGGWFAPRRWDVAVFRDPADPEQHYIKRLVGLPGESIEIVDGDVFIDGRIARKPAAIQAALWLPVFDQAYLPDPRSTSGQAERWRRLSTEPHEDGTPGWYGLRTRVLRYRGLDDTPRTITFNADASPEYGLDFSGFNGRSTGQPVHDVRVVGDVTFREGTGWVAWQLGFAQARYEARLSANGEVTLVRHSATGAEPDFVRTAAAGPWPLDQPRELELTHVDYRVSVRVGGRALLSHVYEPDLADLRAGQTLGPARVGLAAAAVRAEVRGPRIERDVYYTHTSHTVRAYPGHPFQLGPREYFALGDNSADSHDSREWTEVGPHLPNTARPGCVPAGQIVGRAAFVYLPGLLPRDERGRWSIPDVGRMRFVR